MFANALANWLLFSTSAALAAAKPPHHGHDKTIKIVVPTRPKLESRVIDAAFVSYSIEFQENADFGGNLTQPNHFTNQMLENLKIISGEWPMWRVGGMPQDQSYWDPTLDVALNVIPGRKPEYPSAVYFGPKFFESCATLPEDVKLIWGLTMGTKDAAGYQNVLDQGREVWKALGDRIYALEVGNEPEYFPQIEIREEGYSVEEYVPEWLNHTEALTKTIPDLPSPVWQAGSFQSPGPSNRFNVSRALDLGADRDGRIKTVSEHQYMGGGDCTVDTVLNRTIMISLLYRHALLADEMVERGYEYVIGETNTCFGHGREGVSNAYASGLWAADYTLYSASLNISRLWYHQGTIFRYSAWQPIDVNSTNLRRALPVYYGNLLTAEAFAGGNKQVVTLINETYVAAYGIYSTRTANGHGKCAPRLTHIAVLDKTAYDPGSYAERKYTDVVLPRIAQRASVKRLTAPSVYSLSGVTYGGQSVDHDGKLVGKKVIERPRRGKVSIGQAEALLIEI